MMLAMSMQLDQTHPSAAQQEQPEVLTWTHSQTQHIEKTSIEHKTKHLNNSMQK